GGLVRTARLPGQCGGDRPVAAPAGRRRRAGRAPRDPRPAHVRRPRLAGRDGVGAAEVAVRRRIRVLRALSSVLIAAGVLLLLDAGLTLVWQEPLSALYARIHQDRLAGQLPRLRDLTGLQLRALARLRTERRRIAYRTEKRQIVSPDAYDYVTATRPYDRLALTACHPLYSAARRIVVFARLVGVQALGRARVPV